MFVVQTLFMKAAVVFLLCLFSLACNSNITIVVPEHDLAPGQIIQRTDLMSLVVKPHYPLPNNAIRCWIDCRDHVIGHKAVHSLPKYEPITATDIN